MVAHVVVALVVGEDEDDMGRLGWSGRRLLHAGLPGLVRHQARFGPIPGQVAQAEQADQRQASEGVHRHARPRVPAHRVPGASPPRAPRAHGPHARRLAGLDAARSFSGPGDGPGVDPGLAAGPARPQRGALGRSSQRRAASRRLRARPAPPSLPLPQLSRASLGRGVAASKKCSPPSSDSPLPTSPRFLPPPNFSRLCFPFLLLRTLQPPARPLAPPGVLRTVGLPAGRRAGPQRGKGGRHGLGGPGGTPRERMRESCNICRGRAPGGGAGRGAAAPPPGGKPRPGRPLAPAPSRPPPGPGREKEGEGLLGIQWNSSRTGQTFQDLGVLASLRASPGRDAPSFLFQPAGSTVGETEVLS